MSPSSLALCARHPSRLNKWAHSSRRALLAFEQAISRLIRRLTFQPAPLWPGVGSVFDLFVPQHLAGYPRYHVSVEFTESVGGPILAGLGRHYGLGLFARVR